MHRIRRAICALVLTSVTLLGMSGVAHARTLLVHVNTFDPIRTNQALLFALHSLRNARGDFGGEPFDLTVKVLFSGPGVLNASKFIKHPKIRIETRPEDPPKNAKALIRALRREGVEMRATGFGLKQHNVQPDDLIGGIESGGAPITPRFVASPEEEDGVVVMTF